MDNLKFFEENCSRCNLNIVRNRYNYKIAVGKGNIKSNILIVGEGLGEEEAKRGIPFVGRAGKMLDSILKALDLTLNDVYISNVVIIDCSIV